MKTIPQNPPGITLMACLVRLHTSGLVRADADREPVINVSAEKMDAIIIASGHDGAACGCPNNNGKALADKPPESLHSTLTEPKLARSVCSLPSLNRN